MIRRGIFSIIVAAALVAGCAQDIQSGPADTTMGPSAIYTSQCGDELDVDLVTAERAYRSFDASGVLWEDASEDAHKEWLGRLEVFLTAGDPDACVNQ